MSQLLLWATEDKPFTDVLDLFTVRPRAKKKPKYDEEQPSDIVDHRTQTGIPCEYCSVCDKRVDGLACGDKACPF